MSTRLPRTLAISPTGTGPLDLRAWLDRLRTTGIEAVQVRCKDSADADVVAGARLVLEELGSQTAVLINGRADIARIVNASGVHLPAAGVPVAVARACLAPDCIVGRSTHSIEEVRAAAAEGVDYITFGPIHGVPGKAEYGPAPGIDGLRAACAIDVPVLALGGVTTLNVVRDCLAAGAWGVAGIRIFTTGGAKELVGAVESHGR